MGSKRKKGRGGNSKKQKNVKLGKSLPSPSIKVAHRVEDPESSNKRQPVWVFSVLDLDGPWGKIKLSGDTLLNELFPKIKHFERMTWNEIQRDKKRNHSVMIEDLCKEARDRAVELKLDVDELFRFRLTGKQRLWGIRDRERFRFLWWDPNHEICPSKLRNT